MNFFNTVLRRTPRVTTFVKSYSENIVNFNSQKEPPVKKKCNRLSFCVLNVGGLRSKMKSEDFFDFLNDYDIIGLLEVKMDKNDLDSIKNEFGSFEIFCNIDKEYSTKPRGGIILLIKKNLVPFVHIFPSEQNLALFFQIKAEFLNSPKDLICGCTYIPPFTSLYNDKKSFENLEAEIIQLPGLDLSDLIIFGDLNAKTKTEKDFIDFDKYDFFSESEEIFSKSCSLNRENRDTHDLDLHGKKLIDFCKTLKLRIVNGRVGEDKGIGQFTTRNNSVVDYCLAPSHFFSNFLSFEIHEFNPLFSDVHCPITFELEANINKDVENFKHFTKPRSKWDPTKLDEYVKNFKQMNLVDIENKSTNLSIESSPESLKDIIVSINKIFKETKFKTFPPKEIRLKKKKPWYDISLQRAKKNFCTARKRKPKTNCSHHGKFYKKLINSKFKTHTKKTSDKLRAAKTQDPKYFWSVLNNATNQKVNCNITPEEFEKHFKNLNEIEETDTKDIINNEPICFNHLNAPIEEEELKKGLRSLKNNKSTGPDEILNEQIKSTFPMMKNIYLKLFNTIFDTGCFPESWAEGLIVPIYKKKGSKSNPNNYRGITLISCLAKFFTIILNNRLKIVAKWVISQIQAGFRPGYSTLDHVFTLMCILILYKNYKNFCSLPLSIIKRRSTQSGEPVCGLN